MSAPNAPRNDPSIGRLVADISRDTSSLLRNEIALAKAELKTSVTRGGLGAALFVVAGFLALFLVVLLSITVAYFLTMTGLHPAWAFLIVSGIYVVVIAVLVLVGIRLIKKITAPEKTIATAKAIPTALKGQPTAHS